MLISRQLMCELSLARMERACLARAIERGVCFTAPSIRYKRSFNWDGINDLNENSLQLP